ncbi:HK97-gp10 family putative phage morphogenesis protein [Loigolactobacillus bifermentans]|uniref:HK97 gp10 family phage protein n=1 Tax=Loigolactobacillus bifermentans DSM 20003 TaxID=1423726 RepID=A0A0R1H7W7_9LACO|nr:HK97-gp10 family putative phage morphogenesis protein [Loigolactobacillus bifermentans]KRK38983.1 hypothetical protein FC07_GL002699 [Loigolactobacillus bifermentans DSM 20003]QGG59132.1 hypothetical protein LB003_00905 [Loigolactobacillus bifermentans]
MSENGFEDFQKILKQINVSESQVQKVLKAGADAYTTKLKPNVPKDPNAHFAKRYGSMISNLTNKPDGQDVITTFGASFWWRFVEHGTVKMRAQNFVRNTWNASSAEISKLMITKMMQEMRLL